MKNKWRLQKHILYKIAPTCKTANYSNGKVD
jgi:hypothetical protein